MSPSTPLAFERWAVSRISPSPDEKPGEGEQSDSTESYTQSMKRSKPHESSAQRARMVMEHDASIDGPMLPLIECESGVGTWRNWVLFGA